jgi:hypothetical protein
MTTNCVVRVGSFVRKRSLRGLAIIAIAGGGIPSGDAAVDSTAPCDCSSLACRGLAAPIDPTVVTSFYEANRFLYRRKLHGTGEQRSAAIPRRGSVEY